MSPRECDISSIRVRVDRLKVRDLVITQCCRLRSPPVVNVRETTNVEVSSSSLLARHGLRPFLPSQPGS
jgi:hypothetical protein